MAPSQLGAFARSSPEYETPNWNSTFSLCRWKSSEIRCTPSPLLRPALPISGPPAVARIHARSSDPHDAPLIATNYLSTPEDRRVAVDAIRFTRRIVASPALLPYQPEEYRPGAQLASDSELAHAAGDIGTTIFHPVGTARMGTDHDSFAVTDADLRVRGIAGLRIADASVMPRITSGNTAAPTMMIAEKAAERFCALTISERPAPAFPVSARRPPDRSPWRRSAPWL